MLNFTVECGDGCENVRFCRLTHKFVATFLINQMPLACI
jgi:hypothetical protein